MRVRIWYAQESHFLEPMLKNVGIVTLRAAADPSLGLHQAQHHSLLSAHFQYRINTLAPLVHRLYAFIGHGLEHCFLFQLPLHLQRNSSGLLDQRQN